MSNEFLDDITNGEKYDPAMKITDQAEANAYFAKCVRHLMRIFKLSRKEAEMYERRNLGYWAGYYSGETRARVEKLFNCSHPIFGSCSAEPVSPEAAYEIGWQLGQQVSKKK